jgi:hypothetical protein
MFSLSKDQVVNFLIGTVMLVAMVFGCVDACFARINVTATTFPDDASRLMIVGAAFLGFLLSALKD